MSTADQSGSDRAEPGVADALENENQTADGEFCAVNGVTMGVVQTNEVDRD